MNKFDTMDVQNYLKVKKILKKHVQVIEIDSCKILGEPVQTYRLYNGLSELEEICKGFNKCMLYNVDKVTKIVDGNKEYFPKIRMKLIKD